MNNAIPFRKKLSAWLPRFVLLFCLVQPILDVLTYWQETLGCSNIVTFLIRVLLIAVLIWTGFLLSRKKWIYFVSVGVMALYLTGHLLACHQYGWIDALSDLKDQSRSLMLPLMTLSFVTLIRRNGDCVKAIKLGFAVNMVVFLFVAFLATVTGTDPHTYYDKHIGVLGWFLWGNSQSAILSMVTPVLIAWTLRRFPGKQLPVILTAALCFAMLYFIGTRAAYGTLIGSGLLLSVCIFVTDKARRPAAAAILLLAAAFCALYPFSPTKANQDALKQRGEVKQERLYRAVAPYGIEPGTERTEDPEALAAAYRYWLQGMIDRFGLERVAKTYDYTLKQELLSTRRDNMLRFCELLMEDAPPLSHIFGLEIGTMRQETTLYYYYQDEFRPGTEIFEPENDLHSIYYLCGAAGLALMLAFLLCFGLRALRTLLLRFRAAFNPEYVAFCAAYGFCMLCVYSTSAVLRRVNTSVYLAMVLAVLWELSRLDRYPARREKGAAENP